MWHSKIVIYTFSLFCFSTIVLGLKLDSLLEPNEKLSLMIIPDDKGISHVAILNQVYPKLSRASADSIGDDVKLELYTRSNSRTSYRLYVNDVDNLKKSAFNSSNPIKILIHGFTSNGRSNTIIGSRNAYLNVGDFNIIGVDWGVLCPSPLYFAAVKNAKLVGKFLGEFIEFLVQEGKAKLDNVHIIGHSLGAQVAGLTGRAVSIGKVNRITGLDAAYPMYGIADASERLDKSDAKIVDAIHTCGGSLGFLEAYAHIDFFPNGGSAPQPGCVNDFTGSCSHGKAVAYFIDSIENPHKYPSKECLTLKEAETGKCTGTHTAELGNPDTYKNSGMYYIDTTKLK